jgi:hypothetical protein
MRTEAGVEVVAESAEYNRVVLVAAKHGGDIVLRVAGVEKHHAWEELREAVADAADPSDRRVYQRILDAAEEMARAEREREEEQEKREARYRSKGPWAIAIRGRWTWHAPGMEEYGAVGMPIAQPTELLWSRYASEADARAALRALREEEERHNRPWEGERVDYKVKRYRAADYISEQDYHFYGASARFVQWA